MNTSILRSEVVKAAFATVEQQKSEDADRTIEHKIKNIEEKAFLQPLNTKPGNENAI